MATVQLDRLADSVAALVLDSMLSTTSAVIICRDQTSARIEHDRLLQSIAEGTIESSVRSNGTLEVRFAGTGSTIRLASARARDYLRGRSLDRVIVMDDAELSPTMEADAMYALLARGGYLVRL